MLICGTLAEYVIPLNLQLTPVPLLDGFLFTVIACRNLNRKIFSGGPKYPTQGFHNGGANKLIILAWAYEYRYSHPAFPRIGPGEWQWSRLCNVKQSWTWQDQTVVECGWFSGTYGWKATQDLTAGLRNACTDFPPWPWSLFQSQ